jgi:hypothetical protein
MSDATDRPKPTAAVRKVFCPRLERELPVDEHAVCPFCFGERPHIARGDRHDFCDWKKGIDPINFGFPPDLTRFRSG